MITLFANQGLDWARARIPKLEAWMGEAKSLAAMEDGRIFGVVVYDGWTPWDVSMHIVIADRRCVARAILRSVFEYPFVQLGLARVTGLVPASNQPALDFDKRLGFREEGRKVKAFGDDDEIILGMLRSECRWL